MRWSACGEQHIPPGTDWLVPAEQARVARYRFTKRRTEYLLRRCAGKRAVAEERGWPLDDPKVLGRIGVLNRPGGAPHVEIDGQPSDLDISLTDRAGWAVALLGAPGSMAGGTIGVDLEIVEHRTPGFVSDYFTAAEQEYVRGLPAGEVDAAVNLVWSAKEAALKVLRVGLRADTRTVEVELGEGERPDGWRPLTMRAVTGLEFPGWWRRDGEYLLTLATVTRTEPPVRLPSAASLADAVPTHSWLERPLHEPGAG